jgi:aspartyl-tRNA(Asn)/glutamyl-tRNA(Gln) amidotransferase subunit A
MSVPAELNSQGLPLGLQVIGKPFDEQAVLDAGLAIEQRAMFSPKPERWW